jgi:transcriptional regulator
MYVPPFNTVDDEAQVRAMVAAAGSAQFVTTSEGGYPLATLLPILWEGPTVVAHLARANTHWRQLETDAPALLICSLPEAYITPTWYAAKYEHGRVVPTWNYSAVHLSGTVTVHHDRDWLLQAVTRLTDAHEHGRQNRWRVTDAPERYVQGQLKGIVGLEISVQRVEAKAKLSQNRSDADQRGVIDGLRAEHRTGASDVADAMEARL